MYNLIVFIYDSYARFLDYSSKYYVRLYTQPIIDQVIYVGLPEDVVCPSFGLYLLCGGFPDGQLYVFIVISNTSGYLALIS